jgi:hypothetical protein
VKLSNREKNEVKGEQSHHLYRSIGIVDGSNRFLHFSEHKRCVETQGPNKVDQSHEQQVNHPLLLRADAVTSVYL